MALPPGVITATVTFGEFLDYTGDPAVGEMVVTPSTDLVWEATGTTLFRRRERVKLLSAAGSIELPATDQGGFTDGQGNAVTNWTYDFARKIHGQGTTHDSVMLPTEGVDGVVIPLSSLIPVTGSSGDVVLLPAVTSVDGATGPVSTDAVTAARVTDTDTATGAALAVAFTGTPQPALVGFYAALSKRLTTPVDIVVAGDSISEGEGAATVAQRWSSQFIAHLRRRFPVPVAGGFGHLPGWYASPTLAAFGPTLTGNATQNGDGQRGLGHRSVTLASDIGAGIGALAFTFTGTSFQILGEARVASGTDSVRIVIDGAPFVEWHIVDGTGTQVWSSPALTAGSHTVTITGRFGRSTIGGVMLYNGDETRGIRLWDASKHGTRAQQFSTATTGWATDLAVIPNLSLAVLAWLTNDVTSRTPEQYEQDVRDTISLVRTVKPNCPVMLVAMFERSVFTPAAPGVTWADYIASLRRIAADTDYTAFVDVGQTIPKLAGTGGEDPYGLLNSPDTIHPSPVGHAVIADAVNGTVVDVSTIP